ncbi:MAG: lipid kinase [Trichodesmium sp. St16_bin4-tuft]|nr:lipid kinase [Trichodesmium sp. St4_bin8_1]MDE5071297.1 lipid kinase [Trichodesmium sp. St5_bin8]MDE5100975.1 lipid kinase [Trichodesmium sp. St16_bin4-tuft]MDE5102803.1 lipid kinase [Trichodesmium sp. St19_bin2]
MNLNKIESKKALLLVNFHARKAKKNLHLALTYLQNFGLEIIYKKVEFPQDFNYFIQSYKNQVNLIIIGGGDGTLNLAIDALVKTGLPLGILPLGTANDLARTLGIPISLFEACRVIATGKKRYIDLGLVNGKYFFNVASIGLSVDITNHLTKEAKLRWGVLAYAIAAIKMILQSHPFTAEISCNGESRIVKTLQVAVGNGRHYGGGMTIAHDATIDNQRLDLYSLEVKYCWQFVGILPSIWQGKYQESFGFRSLSASFINVYTRKPHPINTDGEIVTYTPAYFQIVPLALAVIVPKKLTIEKEKLKPVID